MAERAWWSARDGGLREPEAARCETAGGSEHACVDDLSRAALLATWEDEAVPGTTAETRVTFWGLTSVNAVGRGRYGRYRRDRRTRRTRWGPIESGARASPPTRPTRCAAGSRRSSTRPSARSQVTSARRECVVTRLGPQPRGHPRREVVEQPLHRCTRRRIEIGDGLRGVALAHATRRMDRRAHAIAKR